MCGKYLAAIDRDPVLDVDVFKVVLREFAIEDLKDRATLRP